MKRCIIICSVLFGSILFGQKTIANDQKSNKRDSIKSLTHALVDIHNKDVSNSSLLKEGIKSPKPNEKILVQNPIPKDFEETKKLNQHNNSLQYDLSSQGSAGLEIGIKRNNSGLILKTDKSHLNTSELNQNLNQLNKKQQAIIQPPIQPSNLSNFYNQNRPLNYK